MSEYREEPLNISSVGK